MTPLDLLIREKVLADGSLTVAEFMTLALSHPQHGYYINRDPFGAAGDFTTAPEISQMFGELLGLWAVDVWHKIGCPPHFQLIECGPGRGTLMADALRAAGKAPGFLEAAQIVLMEISPALMAKQKASLANYAVTWIAGPDDPVLAQSSVPVILLANEFLDALPVEQFQYISDAWHQRRIGLNADNAFSFTLHPCERRDPGDEATARLEALDPCVRRDAAIVELAPAREEFTCALAEILRVRTGAALLIDYGYTGPAAGDTLQAVRDHQPAPVLEQIGEADLTAHVDFGALGQAACECGVTVWGPVDQGIFLRRLGIDLRAAALKRQAPTPETIEAAFDRLTAPAQMGQLFQVMAISSGLAAPPEGF